MIADNEIIKAFEVCYMDRDEDCSECPLNGEDMECTAVANNNLLNEVFELTKRQKAEIERLQKAIKVQDIMIEQQDYKIKSKSEAIKEFAERFEDEMGEDFFEHYPFVLTALDNVAEEMTNQLTRIEHDSLCETETYKTREG